MALVSDSQHRLRLALENRDFLDEDCKHSFTLEQGERFWIDAQPLILARGYQLRPRYRPDWIPSWTLNTNFHQQYEDGLTFDLNYLVLDAKRISDGEKVVLKRVSTRGKELAILKYLNRPSVRADPRNRTIPLLDVIHLPHTPWSLIIMPYCREFNYPPFHCGNEFLESMSQFLEGLQFMHEHNIAHFDIAPQNMVMEESRVIPDGSHFFNPRTHTGFYGLFSWKDRCSVGPVGYYYIDFGLSLYFPNGKDTALHFGTLRTFPAIPELSQTVGYNPFKVDVFQLGLTMQKLIDTYPDLEDFRPVCQSMTAPDPGDRPTPAGALQHLRSIAAGVAPATLSAQIWEKDTGFLKKASRLVLGGYRRLSVDEGENFWRQSQPFLLALGYQLRPRYRPDWIPSWTLKTNYWGEYEDGLTFAINDSVLDATRMQDGKKVVLKRVPTKGEELKMITYLTTPSLRSDLRNRTIPVLDIIHLLNTSLSLIVMPYCRVFNYPPFHCSNEFIEAMTQFLDGLQFMHQHNISHYDIAPQNMVMDESRVVPNGSHFFRPRTHTGFHGLFTWNNRCAVSPVDYYYIDFGLSLYFRDGKDTALYLGTLRTFPTIPELSDTVPYNPFKVDIFQLGLTMEKLIDAYPDLENFRPVSQSMTAPVPGDRPTPADALSHLRSIAAGIPPAKLSAQIWERDTGIGKKVSRFFFGGYRRDYHR
ncbi:kinase-like domain-containing protein [Mycena belliarum]|uniref:Kinase-like domain-containing protein n=1 Tax=Mycena belliarum TaxID=1033014 RepID=A0AAD6TT75_9AGAR|nr:kinase-like domain-containing protein [Mycena belliae]